MKRRYFLTTVLVMFFALVSGAFAQDAALAQRMKERLPAVDALLQQGLVGEDRHGFLSIRGQLSDEQQATVSGENSDRRSVYAAIARRTGQSADAVGAQRALQIRDRAASGIWVQNEKGEWSQKN